MDDHVDDLIRHRMRDSYPLGHASNDALSQMRPRMERARSARRAMRATAGVSGAALVLTGALLIVPQFGASPSQVDLAGLPGDSDGIAKAAEPKTVGSPSTTDALGRTIAEPEVDPTPEPIVTTSAAPSSTDEPSTTTPPTTAAASTSTEAPTTTLAQTTTQPTTTTTQPTSSSVPATTELPTTTTAAPFETVATSCGSIDVEVAGSGVRLVATHPNAGVEVEVRDAGPANVEVRFERDAGRCEVSVENRDGQVWSEVSED